MGSRDQKKRNTSLSYQKTPNRPNKDKKLIPARNSHLTSALNLITYVYMRLKPQLHCHDFGPRQSYDSPGCIGMILSSAVAPS